MGKLHTACQKGKIEKVKKLLADKAVNVNEYDGSGNTPLHLAAYNFNGLASKIRLEVAKLLIEAGAQVNAMRTEEPYGTPLHCAVDRADTEMVRLLLEKKADLTIPGSGGITSLDFALANSETSGNDYSEIIKLLCEYSVVETLPSDQLVNDKADSSASLATKPPSIHDAYTLPLMSTTAEIDKVEPVNILHEACKEGDLEVVKKLLAQKTNVNEYDVHGDTPLHLVIAHGVVINESVSRVLAPSQANIFRDTISDAPIEKLFESSSTKNELKHINKALKFDKKLIRVEIAKLLIEAGAKVNVKRKKPPCITPLHSAVIGVNTEMVQLLLKKKADTSILDPTGQTVLEIALTASETTSGDFSQIVELLCEYSTAKTDTYIQLEDHYSDEEKQPLLATKSLNSYECNWPLREKVVGEENVKQGSTLHEACISADISRVRDLLTVKANVNEYDNNGYTPLHLVLAHAVISIYPTIQYDKKSIRVTIAQLLIAAGAQVDARSKNPSKVTPLQMAVLGVNKEMVQLLLENNADVYIFNAGETISLIETALTASKASPGDLPQIVEILRNHSIAKTAMSKPLENHNEQSAPLAATKFPKPSEDKLPVVTSVVNGDNAKQVNKLHDACKKGDIESVKSLLADNANVNEYDDHGNTPLHLAIVYGLAPLNETSLSNPNDISWIEVRDAPIRYLVESFYLKEELKNIKSLRFDKKLIRVEIANLLIKAGAKVNDRRQNQPFVTSLHCAVICANKPMVQLLLEKNVDISIEGPFAQTALDYALASSDTMIADYAQIVELLFDYSVTKNVTPKQFENNNVSQPFCAAKFTTLYKDTLPVIKTVDSGDKKQLVSKLHQLCRQGSFESAKKLIGNYPFELDDQGQSLTSLLTKFTSLYANSTITLVTTNNAQVDTEQGRKLHEACRKGDIEAVKKLLAHKVNVNEYNANGTTPLHQVINNKGLPRLDETAFRALRPSQEQLFWDKIEAQDATGLATVSDAQIEEIVVSLYANEVSKEELKHINTTLKFHKHEQPIRLEIARSLIEAGAQINAKEKESPQKTPLQCAVCLGNAEMVQLLLEKNANVYVTNQLGETALDIVKSVGVGVQHGRLFGPIRIEDYEAIVKLLSQYSVSQTPLVSNFPIKDNSEGAKLDSDLSIQFH